MKLAPPAIAIVRPISARFDACLRSNPVLIDLERAKDQHAAYVRTLEALSVRVETVPGDDDLPDACFVEDTAVITGEWALITIPGAPSRQAEPREVSPVVARHCRIETMRGDARLDGGDVLRVGGVLFAGLSERTNEAGVRALAEVAARDGLETRTVHVPSGLHLKSACSLAGPEILLVAASPTGRAIAGAFEGLGCDVVFCDEDLGANVLAIGETVLVSSAAPRTAHRLRARGVRVIELDMNEIHKADGALTCLSLRIPAGGAMCA